MLELQAKNELLKGVKVLREAEYKSLSPEQRLRHVDSVLRKILQNVKNGIMVAELSSITGFDRKTIEKHLERLVAMNIAYKVAYGRTNTYNSNGKIMHPKTKEELDLNDKIYSVFILENPSGHFIYIQEKKRNELNAVIPSGGILIRVSMFSRFVDFLMKINNRLEKEVLEDEIGSVD